MVQITWQGDVIKVDAHGVGTIPGGEQKELTAFDVLDRLGGEGKGAQGGEQKRRG